ncbi:MAG: hypothetical protein ACTSU5_02620 [Promethearchaeota archaeon]
MDSGVAQAQKGQNDAAVRTYEKALGLARGFNDKLTASTLTERIKLVQKRVEEDAGRTSRRRPSSSGAP